MNDKNEIYPVKKCSSRKRVHFALSFKYLSTIRQTGHMQYLLISDISMEAYKIKDTAPMHNKREKKIKLRLLT